MERDGPGAGSQRTTAGAAVRPVGAGDVATLSACLARAFDDDPVSCYLFPRERTHLRRLERYFRWQFDHVFIPRGEGWTTEDLAGASLWIPPARRMPSSVEALVQLATVLPILGRGTAKALRLLEQLDRVHPKTPHCYLGTIGTEPARQGEGIGSSLLGVVLDRLDDEGVPAYLESSKEENLAFYARHGFVVTGEVGHFGDGTPRIWLMWRDPGRSGAARSGLTPHPSAG